jgi:hypothetical protein
MQVEKRKLKDLIPREDNVRLHSEAQIREVAKSFQMFGQIRPIVIDEENSIIAGHGLRLALLSIDEKDVDVYVAKGLTEAQKKKLMLADNKTYEMGNTNYDKLTELLDDIVKLGDNLIIPGYDEETLTMLVSDLDDIDEKIANLGNVEEDIVYKYSQNTPKLNERTMELNSEKIQVETATNQPPRPYVICDHCGDKVWL